MECYYLHPYLFPNSLCNNFLSSGISSDTSRKSPKNRELYFAAIFLVFSGYFLGSLAVGFVGFSALYLDRGFSKLDVKAVTRVSREGLNSLAFQ